MLRFRTLLNAIKMVANHRGALTNRYRKNMHAKDASGRLSSFLGKDDLKAYTRQ